MTTSIKITELADIGAAIAPSTLVPVVNMAGTPTTDNANLQIVGNLILGQAGGVNFVPAAKSVLAGTVTNNAQPNITSTGTLTNLTVNGNVDSGNVNSAGIFSTGTVRGSTVTALDQLNTANLAANGLATLARLNVTNTVNLGAVANVHITGGTTGQVLRTDGAGGLSWVAQSGGGNANTGNIGFNNNVIYSNSGVVINNSDLGNGQTAGMSIPLQGDGNAVALYNSYGNVNLLAGNIGNSQTVRGWTFGADGNLILPDGTIFQGDGGGIEYPTSPGYEWDLHSSDGNVFIGSVEDMAYIDTYSPNIGVRLRTTGTDQNDWLFGSDGNLTLPDIANPSINYANGSPYGGGSTGNFTFSGDDVDMPLVAKLNSGGIGVNNSAEFGTEVTVDGSNVINGSQIYMGAGTAESRAIVNSAGNSLMYTGVENPGFAGTVAVDPGVTSEYAIQVGDRGEIEIGAVVGPITTTEYVAGLGVLNATGNINGLFANANVAVIGAGDQGWTFGQDGNLTLPGDTFAVNYANGDPVTLGIGTLQEVTTLGNTTDQAISITNSTASTSYDTGALLVSGGIGAGGNIHSNNEIHSAGNIIVSGQALFVGTGADILGFTSETLVVFHEGQQFVQAAIVNAADTGSADWVAYGHNGNDSGGWVDTGFTGISFNDPNYTITGPGDGYVFVEGFVDDTTGGNLILATGDHGTTKDIIFATGGFAAANEFGRISDANNALELTRTGATIKFPDTSVIGEIEGANTFGILAKANSNVLLETSSFDGVVTTSYVWDFTPAGDLLLPGNIVTAALPGDSGNITGANVISANYISTGTITLTNGAVIKDNAGNSVAFGQEAGQTGQGANAVAIGQQAGFDTQGVNAVAIGPLAGEYTQGANAVAVGFGSGYNTQGANAVAIGQRAAEGGQGDYAVAIGAYAGQTNQGNNSIVLNATGAALNQTTANTFTVAPVRNDVANIAQVMFYNTTSKEVTYGNTINVAGNITAGNIILSEGGTLTNNIPPATFDILYQYDNLIWSGNTLTFTNASSTYMLGVLALMQVGDTITLGGTPTTVTGAYTGGGAGTFTVSGTGVGQQIAQFTLPNRLTSVNGIKLTTNSQNYLFTEAGVTQSPVLTVDTLPSGVYAIAGFRAFVSDANLSAVGNFGEIVGNGGANTVSVWCDGINWLIG